MLPSEHMCVGGHRTALEQVTREPITHMGTCQGPQSRGWRAVGGTCSSPFPGQAKPKQLPNPLRPSTSLCCPTHQSPSVPLTWVLSLWRVPPLAQPLPGSGHPPAHPEQPTRLPGGSPGTPGLGLFLASIQLLFRRAGSCPGSFWRGKSICDGTGSRAPCQPPPGVAAGDGGGGRGSGTRRGLREVAALLRREGQDLVDGE